ncbi:MAG TPA: OmpA family protein [Gemmatimonadaceae bacterium]
MSRPIHFELDSDAILASEQSLLDQKAAVASRNATIVLRLEGNGDERGSDEYNIALGMRRAAAVKRYLIERGILGSRLETTTYGESRPACGGHEEACWSKNRRVEFVLTGRPPGDE